MLVLVYCNSLIVVSSIITRFKRVAAKLVGWKRCIRDQQGLTAGNSVTRYPPYTLCSLLQVTQIVCQGTRINGYFLQIVQ